MHLPLHLQWAGSHKVNKQKGLHPCLRRLCARPTGMKRQVAFSPDRDSDSPPVRALMNENLSDWPTNHTRQAWKNTY